MNENGSWLTEINRLNTNMNKTQPEYKNDYRLVPVYLINQRVNKNKLPKTIYNVAK